MMGLRDEIQTDIATAFDTDLADAVQPFTGSREIVSDTYDPSIGGYPTITVSYTGRGVFGGYRMAEVDGQHVLITDVKLTALQSEIANDDTGATETPKVDDALNEYAIVDVGQDPAGSTWTLRLRRA